jgi:hypothetical protein
MNTITIDLKDQINLADVQNLLISAFDPASNAVGYWCEIVDYVKPNSLDVRTSPDQIYRYCDYPVNEGGSIVIRETEGDGRTFNLGLSEINKGLKVMHDKYPDHWADFKNDNEDNITADVFVQCALFGELIYG